MALASRKSGDLHDKTGSDLAAMKTKFDNNKHLDYSGLDEIDVLLYQIQLLREDIDELRRFKNSNAEALKALKEFDPNVFGEVSKAFIERADKLKSQQKES